MSIKLTEDDMIERMRLQKPINGFLMTQRISEAAIKYGYSVHACGQNCELYVTPVLSGLFMFGLGFIIAVCLTYH